MTPRKPSIYGLLKSVSKLKIFEMVRMLYEKCKNYI